MIWITIKNLIKVVFFILIITSLVYFSISYIQTKNNVMDIEKYSPISTLDIKETKLKKSKFPFIDVHNHQFDMPLKNLNNLVSEMDSLNMAYMINLSGFRGLYLEKSLKNIKESAPTRFGLFVNIDFEKIDDSNFESNNIKIIQDAVKEGVIGLKVYKSLGLTDKDSSGNRISVNDPRLDPIWSLCGKLNIPVLIHSGEPESFWFDKN